MEEINDVVQIINLGAKGMAFALKGAKTAGRLAKAGIDAAELARMQMKLKLHYASLGENKTMQLKNLETITGGDYRIMNIPTEDKQELIKFYDALKKLKVPFAQLPDLNIGDGFTQIAYNPQDADKIRSFVENYEFPEKRQAKESDLEQYMETATEKGINDLTNEAVKEAKKETEEQKAKAQTPSKNEDEKKVTEVPEYPEANVQEQSDLAKLEEVSKFEMIQLRNNDDSYIPLTIDKGNIITEDKEVYITRVPFTWNTKTKEYFMLPIQKSQAMLVNNGETILTHIKKGNEIHIVSNKGRGLDMLAEVLYKEHYGDFHKNYGNKGKSNIKLKTAEKNKVSHGNKVRM